MKKRFALYLKRRSGLDYKDVNFDCVEFEIFCAGYRAGLKAQRSKKKGGRGWK